MLDARSGRVLRTTPIGRGASPLAIDEQRDSLIVANVNDNTLSILDTRSGRLLRTMPTVVQGPTAITVAESTGHVFVANADVSNGPDSSTSNDPNLLTRLGHMGANGIKVLRRGWTGSVSMLDARVLR
jgi:DNA-binding beta-propeller fold protein YncE